MEQMAACEPDLPGKGRFPSWTAPRAVGRRGGIAGITHYHGTGGANGALSRPGPTAGPKPDLWGGVAAQTRLVRLAGHANPTCGVGSPPKPDLCGSLAAQTRLVGWGRRPNLTCVACWPPKPDLCGSLATQTRLVGWGRRPNPTCVAAPRPKPDLWGGAPGADGPTRRPHGDAVRSPPARPAAAVVPLHSWSAKKPAPRPGQPAPTRRPKGRRTCQTRSRPP